MYKKKYDAEESRKKMERRRVINWAIMLISLGLIVFCYYCIK